MAVQKIKTAGGLVALGGVARQYLYGTGTPSGGAGNDKDVYTRLDYPYTIYQKLSGTWTDVTWTFTAYFTTYAGSDYPAYFDLQLLSPFTGGGGSVININTNYGSFSVGFYDSSYQSPTGSPIDIDVYMYSDVASQVTAIASQYSNIASWASVGSVAYDTLRFQSLDAGGSAYINWDIYGGVLGTANAGTNYGGTSPGTPGPNDVLVKAAEAGKRHLLDWGYVSYIGSGETSSSYILKYNNAGLQFANASTAENYYTNLSTSGTPIGNFGIVNDDVYCIQTSGALPDGVTRSVTINGYTLTD